MNLLYLVVDRNFTPLLGSDVRLDLEVLQFNHQLIDTPVPNPAMSVRYAKSMWRSDYLPEGPNFEQCRQKCTF